MKTIPVLLSLCLLTVSTHAASPIWNGSDSVYWGWGPNWTPNGPPQDGDVLTFPGTTPHDFTTNNLPNLKLSVIYFTGPRSIIAGSQITLTNGIFAAQNSGNSIVDLTTVLAQDLYYNVAGGYPASTAQLWFYHNIRLNGHDLTLWPSAANSQIVLFEPVQESGSVIINGPGVVRMNGANTFTGTTRVDSGTLELGTLSGNAIPGPLIIGDGAGGPGDDVVRLLTGTVIGAGPITVRRSGRLDLNGYSDGIGALTLNGGSVVTGTGTLTLGDTLTSLASPQTATISGKLDLGLSTRTITVEDGSADPDFSIAASVSGGGRSVGIIKSGVGVLSLLGASTFAGETTINNGILEILHPAALGSVSSGTTIDTGGTLRVPNGVTSPEPLRLNGTGFNGASGALLGEDNGGMTGDIIMETPSTVRAEGNYFMLSGAISGTGPLTKGGSGTLAFSGFADNTFLGDTIVAEGGVTLAKTGAASIPSHLVIGTGAPFGPNAIASYLPGTSDTINGSITVNRGGLYNLNGQNEGFTLAGLAGQPPLRLNGGGDVRTDAGLLTLPADTAVVVEPGANGTSSISGRIGLSASIFSGNHTFAVNSAFAPSGPALTVSASLEAISSRAHVIKTGPGEMRLTGNNTYTGQLAVKGGRVTLASSGAVGAPGGGVIVSSNAVLAVDGSLTFNNETLTLNSTAPTPLTVLSGASIWNSNFVLNANSAINVNTGASLEQYGGVSGSGTLTKVGPGALYFKGSTANTYTNTTTIREGTLVLNNTARNGTIVGPLVIGDEVGGPDADVVRLDRVRQIGNSVPVTINFSGLLDLNGLSDAFGALSGIGHVNLNGGLLEVNLPDATSTFDGVIRGAGDFYKDGTGTLTLNGNNTYTGRTVIFSDPTIGGGTLLVNGSQPQSAVAISNGCTLGGSGRVGSITVAAGGTVSPGTSAGILTSGGVTFNTGSVFRVELNGTAAGTGYDQLNVQSGAVQLGGATLNATLGFPSASNNTFTIINMTSSGAVSGTFSGLPPNATLSISGIPFRISYTGGTGNDVVLTQLQSVTVTNTQPPILVRGPYLQSGTVSNIMLRWRTDQAVESKIMMGPSPLQLSSQVVDSALETEHAITLNDLQPDTRYYYAIASGADVLAGGADYFFVTSPAAPKPTRLWVIGDSGSATAEAKEVYNRYREFTGARPTDVWLMLGDNAYGVGRDDEYQRAVFDMYPELLRQTPVWSTLGNHETYSSEANGQHGYFNIFNFPTAGEAGGEPSGTEHYYSFDYGNIHVVCLDSEESGRIPGSPMLIWLEEDLAANTKDWTIAMWHSPPYTKGSHDSDNMFDNFGNMTDMRTNVVPILESYGVDLVLCGHSHNYERSFLMNGHYGFSDSLTPSMIKDDGSGQPGDTGPYLKPDTGPTANQGTVYVVAGSSGWATFQTGRHPVMHTALLRMGSLVLDITGNRLDAKFLRETGAIDDHFTIIKGAPPEPLRIATVRDASGALTLRWKSRAGQTYRLEKADNLTNPDWQPASEAVLADGATTSWTVGMGSPAGRGFFRVTEVD